MSKLEKRIQIKIAAKIDELAENPRPYGYKKLVDKDGTCRVKVSDYRILYDILDKVLIVNVISIAKRNERTYLKFIDFIRLWLNRHFKLLPTNSNKKQPPCRFRCRTFCKAAVYRFAPTRLLVSWRAGKKRES